MDMLKDLLKKKGKGGEMDPKQKEAKMGVLKDIRDMAADSMGNDVRGIKKVSVMAPDQHGLAEGLDTAKQMVGGEAGDEAMEGENPDVLHEHPKAEDMLEQQIDHEADEGDLSADDIDMLIAELQAKKDQLSKKPE